MLPVTRLTRTSMVPTSMQETEMESHRKFFLTRKRMLVTRETVKKIWALIAAGTWMKMMR